jgi:hypothetical protein
MHAKIAVRSALDGLRHDLLNSLRHDGTLSSHVNRRVESMLDRIAEWLLAMPDSIPILLAANPGNATQVRALFALLLIALFVYIMAMRPFGSVIGRLFGRHPKDREK